VGAKWFTAMAELGLPRKGKNMYNMSITNLAGPDLAIAWASERQSIYLRKLAGEPFPWSFDPILSNAGSFTNCQRELDKTTRFYAENIRERYQGGPELSPLKGLTTQSKSRRTQSLVYPKCRWP
jgi:hypothetical protein